MNIEQQEIINHALISKENLHIALAVGKSYDTLRELLIRNFAKYLEQKLKEKEWETNFSWWNNKPFGKSTGFMCRKESWPNNIKIYTESTDGQTNYYVGVFDEKNDVVDYSRNDIFNKCNESISQGSKSSGYIWRKYLPDEYRNFDNADTFFALNKKEAFSAYLLAEIEALGAVVDSELAKAK